MKMQKWTLRTPDMFQASGFFFLLWACYNTYLDVSRYGADWGLYWWFCNLATFGIGIGLLFKLRDLICGFLAIASYTQIFWIIDNTTTLITGTPLLGLVGSMYQPGLPMDEFLSVHYHYFTIPVALFALFHLPIADKPKTHVWINVFNPFIFAVSYFAFPASQNINCIHFACHSGLSWKGPIYSLGFWAFIFTLHHVSARVLDEFFKQRETIARLRKPALLLFSVVLLGVFTISYQDYRYKDSLPKFACVDGRAPASLLDLQCEYTRDYSKDSFLLTFTATNPEARARQCDIHLESAGFNQLIQSALFLDAGESREVLAIVPNPTRDVSAKLSATCK